MLEIFVAQTRLRVESLEFLAPLDAAVQLRLMQNPVHSCFGGVGVEDGAEPLCRHAALQSHYMDAPTATLQRYEDSHTPQRRYKDV